MPEKLKKLLDATEESSRRHKEQIEISRRYYENRDAICSSGAAAIAEVNGYLKKLGKNPLRSADNRISANWHRIITDQKAGYMCSYPPQIDIDGTENAACLCDALGAQFGAVLKKLCVEAANCGVAWLAYWYDEKGKFCFWQVPAQEIRAVYDPESIKPKLLYVIRTVFDGEQTKYELWSANSVVYYIANHDGEIVRNCNMGNDGEIFHPYAEIPFIPFYNNGEGAGDLRMYKQIIDAIDKLISGFANDIDDMQEIIWVIKNYAGETARVDYDADGNEVSKEVDLLRLMKAKKLINVDGDGGVDALKSEIPYEARNAFLEILMRQLYISAMAVDPFPQAVGQASGVYIDFLYSLLELKCGITEAEFRPAVNSLCRAAMRNLGIDPVDCEQVWIRNKPRDALQTVEMMAKTPEGVLSRETMTKTHPLTENWFSERERVAAQQER